MTHTYKLVVTLCASALALAVSAQSRQAPSTSTVVSPQTQVVQPAYGEDTEFLLDALRGSKMEAQMGQLAAQRGASPAVRELGQKLEADHTQVAREITLLLEPLNMNVPTEPTPEAQSHHAALAKLSGQEFDKAFVPLMVRSHEESIEKYEAQTHANPNKQISDLASKQLPVLREHLARAESLRQPSSRPSSGSSAR
jgi:putative membrane protein